MNSEATSTALGLGEPGDGCALGVNAQSRLALLPRADPVIRLRPQRSIQQRRQRTSVRSLLRLVITLLAGATVNAGVREAEAVEEPAASKSPASPNAANGVGATAGAGFVAAEPFEAVAGVLLLGLGENYSNVILRLVELEARRA